MSKLRQVYQSLTVGMLLCAVGGSLDADSFLLHGHVFAGLQTGNLVMLGAGYSQLNMSQILKYVAAIVAFVMGLVLMRISQDAYDREHRHQISLPARAIGVEMILLLLVCILSRHVSNLIVIAMMSLVGAIQLQSFQIIKGNSFTPLMMMGHIKKLINFMDKGNRARTVANLMSLVSFFAGAVITGLLLPWIGDWSLIFAIVMLLIIIFLARIKKLN